MKVEGPSLKCAGPVVGLRVWVQLDAQLLCLLAQPFIELLFGLAITDVEHVKKI